MYQPNNREVMFDYGLPFQVQTDDGQHVHTVELFKATLENINALWSVCQKYKVVLPDHMKSDPQLFLSAVMSPQTVILAIDDVGIAYATDIIPGDSALGHYLFWDKGLRNRSKLVLKCMKWMMETFDLARVSITLPRHASAALHHVYKMGFRVEGMVREGMAIGGKRDDCFVFGVLRRELDEEALERGSVIRDQSQEHWYGALSNDDALMRKIMER
jgi:hypothetical protein